MRRALIGLIASGALAASSAVGAQSLGDRFKQFMGSMDGANGNSSAQQLPESEVVSGLRAALADGASAAVTQLGQTDGFSMLFGVGVVGASARPPSEQPTSRSVHGERRGVVAPCAHRASTQLALEEALEHAQQRGGRAVAFAVAVEVSRTLHVIHAHVGPIERVLEPAARHSAHGSQRDTQR